jgi:glyoxylase-like metal-dependent hydrolase (beta-lactamase superfamily II)
VQWVKQQALSVRWILETHAHADHVSAADFLKAQLGGQTAIGAQITEVQYVFKELFQLESAFATDGRQFDRLLRDGDQLPLGHLSLEVMHLPGHTPADVAYKIGDAVLVGDTLFMPDVGTARCDFPGGNAQTLYQSVRRLLALPPDTRLYMCHDYPPGARDVRYECTVAEQRAHNIHVSDAVSEPQFVEMRSTRDAGLALPVLMLPAVQINIRAGALPPADPQGRRFLKIPLNAL